jgi:hypothetical protein
VRLSPPLSMIWLLSPAAWGRAKAQAAGSASVAIATEVAVGRTQAASAARSAQPAIRRIIALVSRELPIQPILIMGLGIQGRGASSLVG